MNFILLGIWLAGSLWRSFRFAQFFQIEEYENVRFLKWLIALQERRPRLFDLRSVVLVAAGVGLTLALTRFDLPNFWVTVIWIILAVLSVIQLRAKEAKKPLVLTARAARLISATFVVIGTLFLFVALPVSQYLTSSLGNLIAITLIGLLAYQLAPTFLISGNIIVWPIEFAIRRYYLGQAKQKLSLRKPYVIGITGSYGKTSTKDFLATVLSSKYKVFKTPRSFNTLMGISRIINSDFDPEDHYDFFIAEMGAYQRGEIRDLCRFVEPQMGIITAIGPQHLERFGSIEIITRAKLELFESLPKDGVAIFNWDDQRLRDNYDVAKVQNCYAISVQDTSLPLKGLVATEIEETPTGLNFCLVDRETNQRLKVSTNLLGRHNVHNLLLVATAAVHLGLSLSEIVDAIEKIEPVEHRLRRITRPNGITILDDSYNSNPEGAKEALHTLSLFSSGYRILVTPGFVELGEVETEENFKLGVTAASACNSAILVGASRTKPIYDGLVSAGFAPSDIIIVDTFREATEKMTSLLGPGDTVLLLNDLPDTY
jgi:UDP-N-acetylmuramoyl-tripeptide--D-alanyl-D-alanine ligase